MKNLNKKINTVLGNSILLFPILLIIAFSMHFTSFTEFFMFRFDKPEYDSYGLFDFLIHGGNQRFIHAHLVAYFSMPFFILMVFILGKYLFYTRPILAISGVSVSIFGAIFMSGVFASWINFTAVSRVSPEYYDGARASLIELTKMSGTLSLITSLSFLSLIGIMILSLGYIAVKNVPIWSALLMFFGSLIITIFMDMDNWMLIGSLMLLIGLVPIRKFILICNND